MNKSYLQHPIQNNVILIMSVNNMNVIRVPVSKIEVSGPLKWFWLTFCKLLLFYFKVYFTGYP